MKKLQDFTSENLDLSQLMDAKEMNEILGGSFICVAGNCTTGSCSTMASCTMGSCTMGSFTV